MMRISQLAEHSGVPATTLRFYETAGLLPAARTPSGYRVYAEDALDRLAFIGAAKHLGLALEEIAELLGVWEAKPCGEVKAHLRERVAARITDAERRSAELATFTASLHRAVEHLDSLPDRTSRCNPHCAFLTLTQPTPATPPPTARVSGADDPLPTRHTTDSDQHAARDRRWRELLADAHGDTLPDGVRLTVPVDRTADVAALAAAEAQADPALDLRLHLDGPVLHLEVRHRAGTAAELDRFLSAT